MPARTSTRAPSAPSTVAQALAVAFALSVCLAIGAMAACTDGTTPDCSDAQCLATQASDAASEASADSSLDSGGSGKEASLVIDAADASPSGDGTSPDATDAPPSRDGSSVDADGGEGSLPPADGAAEGASD